MILSFSVLRDLCRILIGIVLKVVVVGLMRLMWLLGCSWVGLRILVCVMFRLGR